MERNQKGQFEKGITPWNKGLKGVNGDPRNATSFQEGKNHPRYRPIGSERIDRDGYLVVKVADRKWVQKHRHLWEKANGPVPRNHVIVFGNGNKRDFRPENLLLVSRAQLAVMNKKKRIFEEEELTRTGAIISELEMVMNKATRKEK